MDNSYAIQPTGLTSEDLKYIRKVSLKTLLKFFSAEFIGFGFGVPLATVTAIGYGNIASIFMEVYFYPIVFLTIFIVVFVAFPTNIYLSRKLIKVILKPSIDDLKLLLFSIARIPLYASLNLFFRVAVGGFIVDIIGAYIYKNVELETFIALFISATFGAWNASILYFFVLQVVIAEYNAKVRDYVSISKKSEIFRFNFLSMRIYPILIFLTVLMSTLLISFASNLGAGTLGQILISISGGVTVSFLFVTSFVLIKKLLNNIINVTGAWLDQKEKFSMYGLYDIEDILRRLKEINIVLIDVDETLDEILKRIKYVPDAINTSSRKVINSFDFLPKSLEVSRYQSSKYSELKKELYKLVSLDNNISIEINSLLSGIGSMKVVLSSDIEHEKEGIDKLSSIYRLFDLIQKKMYSLSRVIESMENAVSYLNDILKKVILYNVEKLDKISKDMEMTSINFQLEMSKLGYIGGFKFISSHINKALNDVVNLSKDMKNTSNIFEKQVMNIYSSVKNIFVLYDSQLILLSEKSVLISETINTFKEVGDFMGSYNSKIKKLVSDEKMSQRMKGGMATILGSQHDLSVSNVVKILESSISRILELQKLMNSHLEKVKNMRKISNVFK
ncbi:MAG: hypothetical protein ACK4F9_04560 [Brevinematia bacterium]